jgi:hypothetical protein
MSSFVAHHPCPKCGSSDAFGEFSDGHFYCFSCRNFVPATTSSIYDVEKRLKPTEKLDWKCLPFDCKAPSNESLRWLRTYGITDDEITSNNLKWSGDYEMLVFPFYGENKELLCWQGRYFPARKPKVYTAGYPDRHILIRSKLPDCNSVVVVEDSISAIKVSRVCDSSELLGSNLSLHKATGLSRLYDNLLIWLDADKLQTAIKFKERYRTLFKNVIVIYSEKDPKEYSTNEINFYIYGEEEEI